MAATLDKLLPNAKLADAEMETLRGLRAEITKLAADQKLREARVVEEQAMKLLGYRKVIFRCGGEIPVWIKLPRMTTTLTPGVG